MPTPFVPAPSRTEAQLRAEAASLRSHPGFPAALVDYTRKLSHYREASRPFAKLIANEDRYRALNFFLTLSAEKVGMGEDGALTYGDLFEICRRGEVSPRILKTMLSLAVFGGFLDRTPNPRDGRSWLYPPTPSMELFPQQWLLRAAEALDAMLPGESRASRLQNGRSSLVHFFRSAGREFASGLEPMTFQPEFQAFYGQKEGGAVFTMALLLAEADNVPSPGRAELAKRYGLTKSQVNQLVSSGIAAGLLGVDKPAGRVHATSALREGHSEWVSISLAFLGHHLAPAATK